MIPVTQTVLHDPANGKHGNCLSAVLASLLHLPIEIIPTFSNNDTWVRDLNDWIRPYGLAYLLLDRDCLLPILETQGINGMYHEIAGPSPRMADVCHACVGLDGQIKFDPHPSRAGLENPQAVGVFIALTPWRMLK